MDQATERREAQIDALTTVIGSMLAVLDVKNDAADLWPETMRNGTPDEIRQVTAELAEVLPACLFRQLHIGQELGGESVRFGTEARPPHS
jgi:hypothetical protein